MRREANWLSPTGAFLLAVSLCQLPSSGAVAASASAAPWQAVATDAPPSGVTYRLVGKRAATAYGVMIRDRAHPERPPESCVTPCTRRLEPGPVSLSISGPGTSSFVAQLVLPDEPYELRLQHFTDRRLIAGTILLGLGLGLSIASSLGLSAGSTGWRIRDVPLPLLESGRAPLMTMSSLGLAHGLVFLITGIGLLGATRRADVSLRPIRGIPQLPGKLQFSSLQLGLSPDLRGATALAQLKF